MINHPYENGTGTCDWCDETMVPSGEHGGLFYDPTVGDCAGWRCDYCESVFCGGHGQEWNSSERYHADRMWESVGKSADFVDGPDWTRRWSWEFYR